MNWLQDFAMSVNRTESGYILPILTIIWLTGIVAFIIFTFFCNRKLRLVKESMKSIEDEEIAALFSQCKTELGIKKNTSLGTSILDKSPITIGLFRARVILPFEIGETNAAGQEDSLRLIRTETASHQVPELPF